MAGSEADREATATRFKVSLDSCSEHVSTHAAMAPAPRRKLPTIAAVIFNL
jgi:hypothetical protein